MNRPALALALLVSLAVPASAQDTRWELQPITDPITDESHDQIVSSGTPSDVRLVVFCRDGRHRIALGHPYMGGDISDGTVMATYRVDRAPAVGPVRAYMGGGHTMSFPDYTGEGFLAFFNAARSGERLVLRVLDPLDNRDVTSTLSLDGFARAVDGLMCPLPMRR
jgi:hypothetical protein